MEQTVTCLLMVQKFINLQQKILRLFQIICFQIILSKQHEKTGHNGNIYDFSVDYDAIDVDHIKDIHKYLMKKNYIV